MRESLARSKRFVLASVFMDIISESAETYLGSLVTDFGCERANTAIQSRHAKFATMRDADMAMLRLAYLKGREDATATPPDEDFDTAVARITGKS